MSNNKSITAGLRIDVDTLRGTRLGVPRLLQSLERHGLQGSFYFSVGPDNMGRHLWRLLKPVFLWKMLRSRAASLYGWDILLRGTFWPGPIIADKAGGAMRAAVNAGHEIGFHAWDHHAWQTRIERLDVRQMRESLERGLELLERQTGQRVQTSAAAGWRANDLALLTKQAVGFRYNSDCRGDAVFIPLVDGGELSPQIPVTLPTYDELIGTGGVDDANFNARILDALRPDALNVYTIHAEVEGIARAELFDELLRAAAERGVQFVPLRQLMDGVELDRLPRARIEPRVQLGREGWVAWQEGAA